MAKTLVISGSNAVVSEETGVDLKGVITKNTWSGNVDQIARHIDETFQKGVIQKLSAGDVAALKDSQRDYLVAQAKLK